MATIFKTTYPNGKIYIGMDMTDDVTYFGSPHPPLVNKDFPTAKSRKNFKITREVLWTDKTKTRGEVMKIENDFIRNFHSNDPKIGYNRHPPFPGKSKNP